jgi:glyoxylase-like metal-dependent hydrolase (beta-lactamase superfamily II)
MISKTSLLGATLGLAMVLSGAGLSAFQAQAAAPAKRYVPPKSVDFSSVHDMWIENMDGTLSRMDEPYFQSRPIAPGTWQILSEGDYWYLVEGDKEAMVIDGGQGAGNPRAYAQTLTSKPVRYIANTHAHFDHTANDGYFDRAFMSQGTKDELPKPGPSFASVPWPSNYPITIIKEGYTFHLGHRDLEAIMLGNHTLGGTAYLDRKQRILFSGDEIMGQQGFPLKVSVQAFEKMMEKLEAHRSEYDRLCAGWEMLDASWVDKYLALAKYILDGHEGVPLADAPRGPGLLFVHPTFPNNKDSQGRTVYVRHVPRGGGGQAALGAPINPNMMRMTYGGATLVYDRTKIRD